LPSGQYPEWGAEFDMIDLRPMREGLALERWQDNATDWWRRATLPWRIGLSPIAAFFRDCPMDQVLTRSPARFVPWVIFAILLLALANNTIMYEVDALRGIYTEFAYDHGTPASRHCSLQLLPVHLPIIWLQGLAVCVIGMVIGWRPLSLRQVLYLATWLMGLALMAGCLATLYEIAWELLLSRWSWGEPLLDHDLRLLLYSSGQEFTARGADFLFGLLTGLAVGTVIGRRRWLVAVVSAVVLYAAVPLYWAVQGPSGYTGLIYWPVRDALWGPSLPFPDLERGPTFPVDAMEPSLAGRWSVQCDAEREVHFAEIVIGSQGKPTRYRMIDPGSVSDRLLIVDGDFHDTEVPNWAGQPSTARYRCFGSGRRDGEIVELNTRLEWYVKTGEPNNAESTTVVEQVFVGHYDHSAGIIEGEYTWQYDSSLDIFVHPRRTRSFVMHRVSAQDSPDREPTP
jgi:hypothetical protein